MHTRWPFFMALVVGVSAVAILWYAVLSNPKGEAVPASGGTYVEGVLALPQQVNPLAAQAPAEQDVASLVFSGLVRLGPDGTPQPDLAERWEITENGQAYVFQLRDGVEWHDGEPFGAEDVVFTYRTISDPAFGGDPALAQLMQGVVVTARDELTVEFKLEQPYAPFLSRLTTGILPSHLLKDIDTRELFSAEINTHPVGTGPYRFVQRTDDRIELQSNATYYLGPPHITTFELRALPGPSGLAEALRSGRIDGALLGPEASASDVKFFRESGRFETQDLTSATYHGVYFDTRSDLFNDKTVRSAFWRAVNVQSLIDETADGRGTPANIGIPPESWAAPDVELPEFEPGAAARALEAAGWVRGLDSIRQKDGVRLAFALSVVNQPQQLAIAENLAKQWEAIGAAVTVEPVEPDAYIEQRLLPRDFQAALVTVDPGPDPDLYPLWHSSQIEPPGRNLARLSVQALDDDLERARQTTDTQRRRELYTDVARNLVDAAAQIPLFHPQYVYVQRGGVHGFAASILFTPSMRFSNVNEWYVNTRVRS